MPSNLYKEDVSRLLYEVARLYYEHQFSQQQIAEKLGVSRPGVSRLLHKARSEGIVKIEIIDPARQGTALENELQNRFHLKAVSVVPSDTGEEAKLKSRLARAAAKFLEQIVSDGTVLGVSWGTTLQAVSLAMPGLKLRDVAVVQLNGGISRAEYDTHASEIVRRLGDRFGAVPYLLPLPAVVDRAELKHNIISDKNIARTLALAEQATVALFTVGSFGQQSALVKADYFETPEVEQLLKAGAVGDICSRIISGDGSISSPELDERTIGISLAGLKDKPWSVAVAGGPQKTAPIRAALNGSYFNVLITDEFTATELLEQQS